MDFNHLKKNDTSYIKHFRRAMYIAGVMVTGGLLCCIHSFFPFIFTESASKRIKKLHNIL
tara:strand:+ start:272 stop:451 length:180 start_codon:yes stop_codon:yes gene_type:complete